MSESKRLVAAVPAKIAAGVLGALLAGSLGAGAMTGTITLTSEPSDAPETAGVLADDQTLEEGAAEEEIVDGAEEEAEVEVEVDEPKDAGDPATAPIPTSVSEAAKNHQFDEACGNHGAYVSHFARTGEEPECATTARDGAPAPAPEADDVEAAETGDVEADAPKTHPSQSKASATGVEKSEAGKAKAAANRAKAPGQAKAKGKAGR